MTIRILFIARYRTDSMNRKLEYISYQPDIELLHICPANWHDEYGTVDTQSLRTIHRRAFVPMLGAHDNPHRALYRTMSFEMIRFHPDVIHAEEEPDSLAALQIALARKLFARQAKLVFHTWQNISRPLSWPVQRVLGITLPAANHIFCANSEAISVLRNYGYKGGSSILPALGVDTTIFKPCLSKASETPFTVGYLGRLVEEKGLDDLIAATKLLTEQTTRRIHLHFIGDGPTRMALQQRVTETGLADMVSFIPPLPPAEIVRHLCRFDALVLPSHTTAVWKEQFGRVLTEAMACGVPVVGSNSGAIPEVIGDAGLVFPEGNVGALADSLWQLIDSPTLSRQLGLNGIKRVQDNFSQQVIAEKTTDMYRKLYRDKL